jgi:molybdate transport system substrate-binding protein
MRNKRLLGVLLLASSATANALPAPQLNIYSTGVATNAARVLGVSYMKSARTGWENGPNFVHTSGTDGRIVGLIKDGAPADVVIVQTSEMAGLEKAGLIKAGTAHPLGRVDIGVMVKKGKPHPDISTYPKFRDALLAAGTVGYTDPASGSAGGILIEKTLSRPEFTNLKRVHRPGLSDEVPIALEAMGQLRSIYGVDFIGKLPESLNAHLDFSIGVLEKSPSPKEALAFEQYVLTGNAAPIWTKWGVVR